LNRRVALTSQKAGEFPLLGYEVFSLQENGGDRFREEVDMAELSDLYTDVLDLAPYEHRNSVLQDWVSRLAHSGVITIKGVNPFYLNRDFHYYNIGIADYNRIIYSRQSMDDPNNVVKFLKDVGLKIITNRVHEAGHTFTIVAERP
jgi:hypothetical protein